MSLPARGAWIEMDEYSLYKRLLGGRSPQGTCIFSDPLCHNDFEG